MLLLMAEAAQKIRDPVCSSELAYVSAKVTHPRRFGDPLQTHLALQRFSCALKMYVHNRFKTLAFGAMRRVVRMYLVARIDPIDGIPLRSI